MIKYQKTKTLITKDNNNSANCIAPNLIYGCFGGCVNSYCYMSRYNDKVYVNTNINEIFESVCQWVADKIYPKPVDQQSSDGYYYVDISCNTDLVLMQKHLPESLHDYLKRYDNHPRLNSTMATKYPSLLNLNVKHFNKKPRIRVSLMPQVYSDILEPKMQKISSRIKDINKLKDLRWEVHCNYSPIIFYSGWENHYDLLFKEVLEYAGENKCEIIALTNHVNQMKKASEEAKKLMKDSCEIKHKNIMRYPLITKQKNLNELVKIYNKYFSQETIRYIF